MKTDFVKKKAAFVDHSFHKKTLSSDFIKELLSEYFDITYYYDESWHGGDEIDVEYLNDKNYEYIFYWQYLHKAKDLKKIKHSKIVFFPMEDSVLGFNNLKWLEYAYLPIKIICFSKRLFDTLHHLKVDCFHAQYYINPNSVRVVNDYSSKRVYFWNRITEINWELIKKILGENEIASLKYMAVPDPYNDINLPDKNDIIKYNIEIYKNFFSKDDYENIVSNANIYIAPRKYEGIGMSFLEAFARGQCVIAPNYMTMNEYIEHGVNGYLYELDNENEINLDNFELVAKEARNRSFEGYKIWKQKEIELIRFILDRGNISQSVKLIIFFKIKFFKIMAFPRRVAKAFIFIINNIQKIFKPKVENYDHKRRQKN